MHTLEGLERYFDSRLSAARRKYDNACRKARDNGNDSPDPNWQGQIHADRLEYLRDEVRKLKIALL